MKTTFLFSVWALFTFMTAMAQNDTLVPPKSALISMEDATVKYGTPHGQQFYVKGSTKPYTGFLCAYYDNGELETVQQYEEGIANGIWMDFDPDGRLHARGTSKNNKIEGPVTFYYEDGSMKSKGQYLHYKNPIGWWTFYDRAGNIVSRRRFTR